MFNLMILIFDRYFFGLSVDLLCIADCNDCHW